VVERASRERALPIDVRLVFEKAGFCNVSLLPRRTSALPDELAVSGTGNPSELVALQEEWYQDVVLPDVGVLLRQGIEWEGSLPDGQTARWSLSGREIYVLCQDGNQRISGFVSTPRLILGEKHVILCSPERLQEVKAAIEMAGSPEPTTMDVTCGIPPGWVGLRDVVPRTPVAASTSGEILDTLRPLADVEIVIEGGIRLERFTWLRAYPPRIRLRGDVSAIGSVQIDGQEATVSPQGGYVAPGWDLPGEHRVWCASGSRSYLIREGADEWEPWDAYTWSMGDASADAEPTRPTICGVLVRPPHAAAVESHAVMVPASNATLLGALPGQIYTCIVRHDIGTNLCRGFPSFSPVWAIPTDPIGSDKRVAHVLMMGNPDPPFRAPGMLRLSGEEAGRVAAWCSAVLNSGRKGLRVEPADRQDASALWREYKRVAKAIWRGLR
jgi:hypothetical protein